MPEKASVDQPGGLIQSPEKYLLARTGRQFHQYSGVHTAAGFALRQADYENRNGAARPNCTPAALVNALGYYRPFWPWIPADPHECYQLLRPHVRLVSSPLAGLGGYPAPLNPVLIRRLWRLLEIDAWPAVFPFPDARQLRRLTREDGAPLVLSFWSRTYRAHTALLLGWELWSDGQVPSLLWRIQDGWHSIPRYLDASQCLILQAIRMAK